jgi:hypothetical protein
MECIAGTGSFVLGELEELKLTEFTFVSHASSKFSYP